MTAEERVDPRTLHLQPSIQIVSALLIVASLRIPSSFLQRPRWPAPYCLQVSLPYLGQTVRAAHTSCTGRTESERSGHRSSASGSPVNPAPPCVTSCFSPVRQPLIRHCWSRGVPAQLGRPARSCLRLRTVARGRVTTVIPPKKCLLVELELDQMELGR